MLARLRAILRGLDQSLPWFMCQYATAQNMNPKNESKAEDMMDKKSPMEGMTLASAMFSGLTHFPRMNAMIQIKVTHANQVPHPTTE